MDRRLGVSLVGVLLATVSSCGDGLPTDMGVTWGCTGRGLFPGSGRDGILHVAGRSRRRPDLQF